MHVQPERQNPKKLKAFSLSTERQKQEDEKASEIEFILKIQMNKITRMKEAIKGNLPN